MSRPSQLTNLSLEELQTLVQQWGFPAFRAKQIGDWVAKGVVRPEEMRNLPADLRQKLEGELSCEALSLRQRQLSVDGTRKYLFARFDGKLVETVFIPDVDRGTVCLSTQVGCVLDCPFCFTGTQKFEGNLTAGEIVAQVLAVKSDLRAAPPLDGTCDRITNIVYMGMGEPLANEGGLHESLRQLLDPDFLGLSRRRITVSTSGLVPAIDRLGAAFPVNLAISLHAANDALRDELVPINRKYPLVELRQCLDRYPLAKQRHITLEYVLLAGVNDRDEDVAALGRFVRPARERVNLIAFNPYPGNPYRASSNNRMNQFANLLIDKGIRATVRKSRGQDIMAACGQLKSAATVATGED